MHTITKKDNQVFIQIQNPKEKTIESIQECKEGRCSCKTEEYKKMEKIEMEEKKENLSITLTCLLYTSPSPRDRTRSRMPSSA